MFKNQDDRYYQIMRANLGDKARMLQHLPARTEIVLDVGGGDGVLAEELMGSQDVHVTVVDASPESVQRVKANGVGDAIEAYADELYKTGYGQVDAILASSVVHEIFSYGNAAQKKGKIENVLDFLKSAYDILRPGGRLIIRDGVSPSRTQIGHLFFPADKAADVLKFQARSPFYGDRAQGKDRRIDFERVSAGTYEGTHASLVEFIFTWTWGKGSFDREVQEYLNVFSLEEFTELAESIGFRRRVAKQYVQFGYQRALEDKGVSLDFPFPYTKAIWVLEK